MWHGLICLLLSQVLKDLSCLWAVLRVLPQMLASFRENLKNSTLDILSKKENKNKTITSALKARIPWGRVPPRLYAADGVRCPIPLIRHCTTLRSHGGRMWITVEVCLLLLGRRGRVGVCGDFYADSLGLPFDIIIPLIKIILFLRYKSIYGSWVS